MSRLSRVVLLLAPLTVLAPLAWAEVTSVSVTLPEAVERTRRFQRNRGLVEALVEQGLLLASEEDPLKRADHCTGVARHLTAALHEAAQQEENDRVAELGKHLEEVLKQGIAANLRIACDHAPAGSAFDQELRQVHDRVLQLVLPLEEQFRELPSDEVQEAVLLAVGEGRAEIEQVLQRRSRPAEQKGMQEAP